MTRRVIPIRGQQSDMAGAGAIKDPRAAIMGAALVVLHLASLGIALAYF